MHHKINVIRQVVPDWIQMMRHLGKGGTLVAVLLCKRQEKRTIVRRINLVLDRMNLWCHNEGNYLNNLQLK